jgi:hypothetical protein
MVIVFRLRGLEGKATEPFSRGSALRRSRSLTPFDLRTPPCVRSTRGSPICLLTQCAAGVSAQSSAVPVSVLCGSREPRVFRGARFGLGGLRHSRSGRGQRRRSRTLSRSCAANWRFGGTQTRPSRSSSASFLCRHFAGGSRSSCLRWRGFRGSPQVRGRRSPVGTSSRTGRHGRCSRRSRSLWAGRAGGPLSGPALADGSTIYTRIVLSRRARVKRVALSIASEGS